MAHSVVRYATTADGLEMRGGDVNGLAVRIGALAGPGEGVNIFAGDMQMPDEKLVRSRRWLEEKIRGMGYSPAGLSWGPEHDDPQGLALDGIRRTLRIARADLDDAAEGNSPAEEAKVLQAVRHWLSATRR